MKFYDWKTFLKQCFKPLSALTTYTGNHFRADKESPGIVFVKEYCDSMEKEFRLVKKQVVIDSSMPSELPRKCLMLCDNGTLSVSRNTTTLLWQ